MHRRGLILVVLSCGAAFTASCSTSHPTRSGIDASGGDGGAVVADDAPMEVSVHDSGPPPQYCPDHLVQRSIADVALVIGMAAVTLESVAGVDVVGATLGTSYPGSGWMAWGVDRASGSVMTIAEIDGPWDTISSASDDTGASFLLCENTSSGDCRRVRWDLGDGAATIDEIVLPDPLRFVIARRDASSDALLRVIADPSGTSLERWDWPVRRTPSAERVGGAGLSDLRLGTYFGRPAITRLRSGEVALTVLATGGSYNEGRIVWLDPGLRTIVRATVYHAGALAARAGLQALPDDALLLAMTDSSGPAVRRVAADGTMIGARVEMPWEPKAAAAGREDAFLIGTADRGLVVEDPGDPGELTHDTPLYLARVHGDGPTIEGGGRPILTGDCYSVDAAAPAEGGVVIASTCVSAASVSLLYACVPGVE